MNNDTWYLDFSENGQMWHHDLERVKENESWVNIGYGNKMVLNHFCDMVDVMVHEFGMTFTTDQIIRLAECTPGLTVFYPTPEPEDDCKIDRYREPLFSRKKIEDHIEWKFDED